MVNDKKFLENARKLSKSMKGDTLTFEVNKEYALRFVALDTITIKMKGKKPRQSDIVVLKDNAGNVLKFWSFGLLSYLIRQKSPKTGNLMYIRRLPKNEKGFWGCYLFTEKEVKDGKITRQSD
jgi:hypothetical protein